MSDPFSYREYACNIKAPYIKAYKCLKSPRCECDTAQVGTLSVGNIERSGTQIKEITGSFPLSTTHTFTSAQLPCLGETECNGDITLYMNNDVYANVCFGAIVRAKSTNIKALIYQRVGNFDSVDMAISGNNVVVTCSPAATCRWIFRGI